MSGQDVAVAETSTRAALEDTADVRCPSCLGLRTIAYPNRDTAALCLDCRRGNVPRETFCHWWLERFTDRVPPPARSGS